MATAQSDNLYSLFMMAAIFIVFYFLIIRPQNQKAKAQQNLINALKKGDEVSTNGGIVGKIISLNDQYIKLEITDQCEITVQRSAINSVLPKGTLKSL